jgi:Tol biopolymer transport system component
MNLGSEVNSEAADLRPSVTPDGKYLFFTSDRSGDGETYWVSSAVIESLRVRSGSR